jgi:hypothetical protein
MKPNRDAAALAASLSNAASAPLPLPQRIPVAANTSFVPVEAPPDEKPSVKTPPVERQPAAPPAKKTSKTKSAPDTVGITLRPERELLNRYTLAAADRTRKEGKVISAQQIMIEVLKRGLQVKP